MLHWLLETKQKYTYDFCEVLKNITKVLDLHDYSQCAIESRDSNVKTTLTQTNLS